MSKTEQDLDVSTEDALTDDAELIEVDATPEGLDAVVIDDDAHDEHAVPSTNGARTGPAGLDDTAEVELDDVLDDEDLDDTGDLDAVVSADEDDSGEIDTFASVVDFEDLDDSGELDMGDPASADTAASVMVDDGDVDDGDVNDHDDGDVDDHGDVDTIDLTDVDDTAAVVDDDTDLDEDDEFVDEGSNPFEIPPILIATAYDADDSDAVDRVDDRTDDLDTDDRDTTGGTPLAPPLVSRDILEELRHADIDGPVVDMAPQDDTTSARRRPKKPIDYDPAPVPIPLQVPRILGRKPRVRKVTRVVRHVDPWSVFKIAIIANMVLYLILLTASVLLWNVAYATGTVDNVERFFESFGWQSFEFNGGEIYHSLWIAGLFVVLGLTGLAVLGATLFNLITDLVGGVRFTVLEEEVVESRTSPMRRFVVRRPEPEIPAVIQDPSGSIIREAIVDDTGDIAR